MRSLCLVLDVPQKTGELNQEHLDTKRKYLQFYKLSLPQKYNILPKDFPPYNTVFYYFNKWKWEGVFEELTDKLHMEIRVSAGKEDTPSLGIIDSRSVKSSHHVDSERGIDGNK